VDALVDPALRIGEAHLAMELTPTGGGEDALRVVAARDGDRAAFGQLYERYARMVHGVLLSHVPAVEVADLAQDVFVLAMRQLHALRDPAAFGGWLLQIARNRAKDFHRRGPRVREVSDAYDPAQLEERIAPSADRAEALAVLAAIRALPEAYRETLTLRLVEGMTGPEISARTGLTPASVRVNLHRGMKQLREALGRSEGHA
jgi:RNA polymerase sigma-70 factor (ECF subfamily)